jgi:hypothetical protein
MVGVAKNGDELASASTDAPAASNSPSDHRPSHLWVGGAQSRPAHPRFFPKSWKGFQKTGK